ncbi:MAG: ABC transporter ATP-binding protein [Planctomycetes bacterium]|nr:ABC transporter ATP-binding protein [Planctomycetota bacterium]
MSGSTPTSVLELHGIEKVYGEPPHEVPVLRGIDIVVRPGEFVAIVGASGSGKSTLLNILGCLDRPTRGSYVLVGEDVARLDDQRLSHVRKTKIGFVFQSFHLVSHLTVEENVELPLFYARVPRKVRRARSAAILQRVGLGHRTTHLPNQLSGGECQRTAVARALVTEPSLLLADEPTGNLDSRTSAEIMRLFRELHQSGRTIVMITHDPGVAAVAGRRITLRDGAVAGDDASAAPQEAACSES